MDPGPSTRGRRDRLALAAALVLVLAVAFGARVFWVLRVDNPFDNLYSDMGFYILRARWLANGEIPDFPRELAMYPPGTHTLYAAEMLLIGWKHPLPFALVHCMWGALVAPCSLLLARRVTPSLWVAALTALLMAVWQPQLVYSGFFSSEQLACGLFALTAWLMVRLAETRSGVTPAAGAARAVACGLAAGITYLVRPQFALTAALLGAAWLFAAWRRRGVSPPPRWREAALFFGLLGLAVAGGAIRYASIAHRPGLIADEDALQRLFADTEIGQVSSWQGGRRWTFIPPSKIATGEMREYGFEGYIGDRDKLDLGRRQFLRGKPLSFRLRHLLSNVDLLVERNWLWPENDHVDSSPRRRAYSDFFESLVRRLLPLAAIGMLSAAWRRTPVLVVASAYVVTAVAVAAFFWGEMRYRVPYDTFLVLLALEGARLLLASGARLARALRVESRRPLRAGR